LRLPLANCYQQQIPRKPKSVIQKYLLVPPGEGEVVSALMAILVTGLTMKAFVKPQIGSGGKPFRHGRGLRWGETKARST
jgi:hypothetical protein